MLVLDVLILLLPKYSLHFSVAVIFGLIIAYVILFIYQKNIKDYFGALPKRK